VDENLCGTTLSPAEGALFTQRRKDIYEALHPETRATKDGGAGRNKETRRQLGDDTVAERFTADTAARTGQSERKVQRDAQRGESVDGEPLRAGRTGSKTFVVGCYCLAAPHARLLRKPGRAAGRHREEVRQLGAPFSTVSRRHSSMCRSRISGDILSIGPAGRACSRLYMQMPAPVHSGLL
jgi:hypothetical protein